MRTVRGRSCTRKIKNWIPNNDKPYGLQLINLHFLLRNLNIQCATISAVQFKIPHFSILKRRHSLTCRPLPFEVWRLQRPRLPLGVVPQLLMICSCFSARSARSSSSSMNCCSRTLAFASRAAVSCRNWSIWATSLWAERGGKYKSVAYFIILTWFLCEAHQRAEHWRVQLSFNCALKKLSLCVWRIFKTNEQKKKTTIHSPSAANVFAWKLRTLRRGDRDKYTTQTEREREQMKRWWERSWIFIQPQAQQGQVPVILRDSLLLRCRGKQTRNSDSVSQYCAQKTVLLTFSFYSVIMLCLGFINHSRHLLKIHYSHYVW